MEDNADFEIGVSIAGATTNYLMDLAQAAGIDQCMLVKVTVVNLVALIAEVEGKSFDQALGDIRAATDGEELVSSSLENIPPAGQA